MKGDAHSQNGNQASQMRIHDAESGGKRERRLIIMVNVCTRRAYEVVQDRPHLPSVTPFTIHLSVPRSDCKATWPSSDW